MRSSRPLLCLIVAAALMLLVAPTTAGAFDLERWKTNDTGWSTFKKGTQVHYRTIQERTLGASKSVVRDVTESKRTLAEVKETELVFTTQIQTDGRWAAERRETAPLVGGYTYEETELGDGDVTIGEKVYPCTRVQGRRLKNGVADAEATFWKSDQHGVLKIEREAASGTGRETKTVTQLSVTRRVGGVTLACREFEIRAPGTKGTVLVSDAVPGQVVELSLEIERTDAKSTLKRTLVTFVKK